MSTRADEHHAHRQIIFSPDGLGLCHRAGSHRLQPGRQRAEDGGQCLQERDESGRSHRARAHRLDVRGPQIARPHLRDGHLSRIHRMRQLLAEEVNQRHHYQPREHAAREDDTRHARANDVAHAKILRRRVGVDRRAFENVRGAKVRPVLGVSRPCRKQVRILEEGIDTAKPKPKKNPAGQRAAFFARDQHIRAGRALGVGQRTVLLHNQLAAQRDHEQHAQPAANQRQHKDARVFEVEAKKDQRGQRKDHAGCNRLARVAGRLHNVVFENRRAAQHAQNADGEHGNGNRRRDGEPRTQAHINRDRAKDDAEDGAERNSTEGELRAGLFRWNKGLKFGH